MKLLLLSLTSLWLYSAEVSKVGFALSYQLPSDGNLGGVRVENRSSEVIEVYDPVGLVPQIVDHSGASVVLSPTFVVFSWASKSPQLIKVLPGSSVTLTVSGYYLPNRGPADYVRLNEMVLGSGCKLLGFIVKNCSEDNKNVSLIDGIYIADQKRN